MIYFEQKGNFNKVNNWLEKLKGGLKISKLDKYAQMGVEALAEATPVRTGKTAASWGYDIEWKKDSVKITWTNSNVVDGTNIAVMINFGHLTRSGYWVEGRNYIEPALIPIFEKIIDEASKEVSKL